MVNCSILSCLHVVQLLLFFGLKYFMSEPLVNIIAILMSSCQNAHLRNSSCHDFRIVAPPAGKKEEKISTAMGLHPARVLCLSPSLILSIFCIINKKNGTLVTNDPHPVRVTISRWKFAPVFRRVVQIRELA